MTKLGKFASIATIIGTAIAGVSYLNASPQVVNNNQNNSGSIVNQSGESFTTNNFNLAPQSEPKLVIDSINNGSWLLRKPDILAAHGVNNKDLHIERVNNGSRIEVIDSAKLDVEGQMTSWYQVRVIQGMHKGKVGWVMQPDVRYQ
ncbi:hypothetical protein [Vibrio hepatarius]|uniref:hypothetical protein n=1 Tax=Vibrio hepatarius TaxID=171383 RepID=UPI001C0A3E8A|nr:hypothetical protein [Vibrio hepatarius]MBU2897701.1 hypothetical protein [Vibrio hepatarius]